jgi:hypothetical protein
VHVLHGALAIPRELRDMACAYGVPLKTQFRNLVLPSIAGALLAVTGALQLWHLAVIAFVLGMAEALFFLTALIIPA